MQKNPSIENSYINDYHKMRSEKAVKEVEEMQKSPLSLEQAKGQIKRVNEEFEKMQSLYQK